MTYTQIKRECDHSLDMSLRRRESVAEQRPLTRALRLVPPVGLALSAVLLARLVGVVFLGG